MESLLVKGIRKKKVVGGGGGGGVRLDVVDEDELMACSKGKRFSMVGKSGFMGKWRSL